MRIGPLNSQYDPQLSYGVVITAAGVDFDEQERGSSFLGLEVENDDRFGFVAICTVSSD